MAIVILGGLITSTMLNLLVLPTLALRYGRFQKAAERECLVLDEVTQVLQFHGQVDVVDHHVLGTLRTIGAKFKIPSMPAATRTLATS